MTASRKKISMNDINKDYIGFLSYHLSYHQAKYHLMMPNLVNRKNCRASAQKKDNLSFDLIEFSSPQYRVLSLT